MKWLRGLQSQNLSQKSWISKSNKGVCYIHHEATASVYTHTYYGTSYYRNTGLTHNVLGSFQPQDGVLVSTSFTKALDIPMLLYEIEANKHTYIHLSCQVIFSFFTETFACHSWWRSLRKEQCIWKLHSYFP